MIIWRNWVRANTKPIIIVPGMIIGIGQDDTDGWKYIDWLYVVNRAGAREYSPE